MNLAESRAFGLLFSDIGRKPSSEKQSFHCDLNHGGTDAVNESRRQICAAPTAKCEESLGPMDHGLLALTSSPSMTGSCLVFVQPSKKIDLHIITSLIEIALIASAGNFVFYRQQAKRVESTHPFELIASITESLTALTQYSLGFLVDLQEARERNILFARTIAKADTYGNYNEREPEKSGDEISDKGFT